MGSKTNSSGRHYYYSVNGLPRGPISGKALKQLAANGELSPEDMIWIDGVEKGTLARSIKGLFPVNAAQQQSEPKETQLDRTSQRHNVSENSCVVDGNRNRETLTKKSTGVPKFMDVSRPQLPRGRSAFTGAANPFKVLYGFAAIFVVGATGFIAYVSQSRDQKVITEHPATISLESNSRTQENHAAIINESAKENDSPRTEQKVTLEDKPSLPPTTQLTTSSIEGTPVRAKAGAKNSLPQTIQLTDSSPKATILIAQADVEPSLPPTIQLKEPLIPTNSVKTKAVAENLETMRPKNQIIASSYREALRLSGTLGMPVLIVFRADWCPHCKKLENEKLPDHKVADRMLNYILVKIDVDRKGKSELDKTFGVSGCPSFLITNSRQKLLKRFGNEDPSGLARNLYDPKLLYQPEAGDLSARRFVENFRAFSEMALPTSWEDRDKSRVLRVRHDYQSKLGVYLRTQFERSPWDDAREDVSSVILPPVTFKGDFFIEMTILSNSKWEEKARSLGITLKTKNNEKLAVRILEEGTGFVSTISGSKKSEVFSLTDKPRLRLKLERKDGVYHLLGDDEALLVHAANDKRRFESCELELSPKIFVQNIAIGYYK